MKIGVISDAPATVDAVRSAVALRTQHDVMWIARSAEQALGLCARQRPDLVLLDLVLPGMDGVAATSRIMAECPCAIVIVTEDVDANAGRLFEALGNGALDAAVAHGVAAKIDVFEKLIGGKATRNNAVLSPARKRSNQKRLVAIGASAGGPAAIATVLSGLPKRFAGAVVIVQHVDKQFVPGMATWLGQYSALPVRLVSEGDRPLPGVAFLAATADHLALKSATLLGYTPDPTEYVYRPSVDVFFRSIARWWEGEAIGVLLSGMGRDGALGLKILRDKGYHTIAQDEASSAVYGMPKAAAMLQAAVDILPVSDIAPTLLELLGETPYDGGSYDFG